MTVPLTTDLGEEYLESGNADGDTITFLLFDDSTDNIQENEDVGDITTEADDAESYARQSSLVSTSQLAGSGGGDWGYNTDSEITFDVETNTETVDAVGYLATFESTVAGDTEPTEHLIAADGLTTTRDLSEISELTFAAGDLEHVISGT